LFCDVICRFILPPCLIDRGLLLSCLLMRTLMRSRHSVPHSENSPQLLDEVLRNWLMRFSAAATVLSFSLLYKFSLLMMVLVSYSKQHLVILLYSCISAAGSGVVVRRWSLSNQHLVQPHVLAILPCVAWILPWLFSAVYEWYCVPYGFIIGASVRTNCLVVHKGTSH
jgi:hypothetical protein